MRDYTRAIGGPPAGGRTVEVNPDEFPAHQVKVYPAGAAIGPLTPDMASEKSYRETTRANEAARVHAAGVA